ncbi:MFS transporter [Cryptosporangium aurantiacum]|uniref:Predicted arabinose efflux permease, MFS family n=1 Tax=Cryptosporangium aurantiacum TaxID=134849 RepID=A0A1M7MZC9_9ACTN|nr:MFS transporter [Cryptosporangium aurantiacum]SHM96575.1 Predicted arabinose efflux permease, MFS family [Cryptosporangium aurantiacum]
MSPGFRAMFSSMRVRNYRLFASGQIVSLTGTWMQTTAQDWLVLDLSNNSGTALGLVTALQFTPILLLTLWAGALADRLDKRKVLLTTQLVSMLLALGMGVLVVTGTAALWNVYVFALLLGTVNAFDTPARQSFISEMVGPDRLPNAVSLNSATFNSARLLGPAIGGLVIAGVGVGPAFLLNGASYLAVLAGLFAMRPAELLTGRRVERARGQVKEGLRFVWGRKDILLVIAMMSVLGTLGMNFNLTLPLLAKVEFDVGPASFGLLSAAFAGGALIGALIGARRTKRPSARWVLSCAAAFGVLECTVAFMPNFGLAAAVLLFVGLAFIAHNNAANARVQLGTPAHLRGRVMSLYMLVFLGGTPLGSLIIGPISERYGPRAGLLLGGSAVLIAAITLAVARMRSRRRRDTETTPTVNSVEVRPNPVTL